MLADRYREGVGVDQSWEQAAHYYKMGVKHGCVGSMTGLGVIYYQGHGVEEDVEKSKRIIYESSSIRKHYGNTTVGNDKEIINRR